MVRSLGTRCRCRCRCRCRRRRRRRRCRRRRRRRHHRLSANSLFFPTYLVPSLFPNSFYKEKKKERKTASVFLSIFSNRVIRIFY